jgi:hypothetical protein
MNEATLTQLKILVERAVRPVRASTPCKRKMREELLAHVSAVFAEEAARLGDERAALERAAERFGNPAELTVRLQEAVPASDFPLRALERVAFRPGESTLRRAARYALLAFMAWAAPLLPAFYIQGRMHEWPILFAGPVLAFGFTFVAEGMRRALRGPAGISWVKAALVAAASCLLVPGVTFGVLLTYSGDALASVTDVLPLLPVSLLTPVVPVIQVFAFASAIRSHQEWAALPIA